MHNLIVYRFHHVIVIHGMELLTQHQVFTWTGTDVNGCDSTVFLTLTINNSTSSVLQLVHVMIIHGMELLTHHQEHILG